MTVRLLVDSIGRLKKGKEYINEVQTRVASQGITIIETEIFSGGDLPEIAAYFEKDDCHPYVNSNSRPCDLNLIILMSNYAANTLRHNGISETMVEACCCLQKVAKSVPTYVIYGGPGEMWKNVVEQRGVKRFDTKAQQIRDRLASSGYINVKSGAEEFRGLFDISDLDYIGHILGPARGQAVEWLAQQVMDAAHDRRQVMATYGFHNLFRTPPQGHMPGLRVLGLGLRARAPGPGPLAPGPGPRASGPGSGPQAPGPGPRPQAPGPRPGLAPLLVPEPRGGIGGGLGGEDVRNARFLPKRAQMSPLGF